MTSLPIMVSTRLKFMTVEVTVTLNGKLLKLLVDATQEGITGEG